MYEKHPEYTISSKGQWRHLASMSSLERMPSQRCNQRSCPDCETLSTRHQLHTPAATTKACEAAAAVTRPQGIGDRDWRACRVMREVKIMVGWLPP